MLWNIFLFLLSVVWWSDTGITSLHGSPSSTGTRVLHNDLSGCLSVPVSVPWLNTLGRLTSRYNTQLCCKSPRELLHRKDHLSTHVPWFTPNTFNEEHVFIVNLLYECLLSVLLRTFVFQAIPTLWWGKREKAQQGHDYSVLSSKVYVLDETPG